MCVIFWNLSKTKYPCKQIQSTLFYLNILLFYFIEIILLISQIEFDLRTFCPVVCFCFGFLLTFLCFFFPPEGFHIKINSVHSMPRHVADSGSFVTLSFQCTERFDLGPFTKDLEKTGC